MKPKADQIQEIVDHFEKSAQSVEQMANFDRLVLETTILLLQALEERLKNQNLETPRLSAQHALQSIVNIRKNNSLRPKYEEMFNQCAVLLVSHFGAALGDLFRLGVALGLAGAGETKIDREELKVTMRQIVDIRSDPLFEPGDLIVQSKDLSFQDMQSTCRAFHDWIGIDIPVGNHMANVIVGQAARHAIVHTGGRINEKLWNRVQKIERLVSLTLEFQLGRKVQFTPDLVGDLAGSMAAMIDGIARQLRGLETQ